MKTLKNFFGATPRPPLRRREGVELRRGKAVVPPADEVAGVHEVLEKIPGRPLQPGGDGVQVRPGVELPHQGGAELVVHVALPQQPDALLHRGQVKVRHPHGLRVPGGAVLHIHGHIVDKPLVQNIRQGRRVAAVGVQLHGKAQVPHLPQEVRRVRLEQRLPAGEDHPVQKAPPGGEEGQDLLRGDLRRLRQPGHQQGVVAEGAPQVAAAGEHRGRQLSGIVHHGQFLKSVNVHGRIPP